MQNFVAKTNSIVGNMKATDNACSKDLYMGERLKPKCGLFVDIIQYRDLKQNPSENFVFIGKWLFCAMLIQIIKVFIFVDLHFGKNQIEKPLLSKIKDEAHEGLNTPFSCLELRRWDLDVLCREC